MPEDVLGRIVAAVERRLAARPAAPDLPARARAAAECRSSAGRRSLVAALNARRPAVIAECKAASPSAGTLRDGFDPVALARAYAAAGAAAISVVTEPDFFAGDPAWIAAVRAAVPLPVLRKDFVVCERQLQETALHGADAVLLINRLLAPERLDALVSEAHALGLEVLLEYFADEDPAAAAGTAADVVGVNARDLATFAVDLGALEALLGRLPADRPRVAESGVRGAADLARLGRAGWRAFLIGEHLVRSVDPAGALRDLLGGAPPSATTG